MSEIALGLRWARDRKEPATDADPGDGPRLPAGSRHGSAAAAVTPKLSAQDRVEGRGRRGEMCPAPMLGAPLLCERRQSPSGFG